MTKTISETVTVPRQRLLERLNGGPAKVSARNLPLRWALKFGFARPCAEGYQLTQDGATKLASLKMEPALRRSIKLLPKLVGKTLVRTTSDNAEALSNGGGYLYHTEPDHKPFPPSSARALIAAGMLVGQKDGLIEGIAQTFKLPGA